MKVYKKYDPNQKLITEKSNIVFIKGRQMGMTITTLANLICENPNLSDTEKQKQIDELNKLI